MPPSTETSQYPPVADGSAVIEETGEAGSSGALGPEYTASP